MTNDEFFDIMAESMALNYGMDQLFKKHNLPFVFDSFDTLLPLLPKKDRLKAQKYYDRNMELMTKLCAENL
jgi:hypothetical protein